MTPEIKTVLDNTNLFKSVQLAESMKPLANFEEETPVAYIFLGDTGYLPSECIGKTMQQMDTLFQVIIVGEASEILALEKAMVSSLIGYQKDSKDTPLQAVSGKNYEITGYYYSRIITFSNRSYVEEP